MLSYEVFSNITEIRSTNFTQSGKKYVTTSEYYLIQHSIYSSYFLSSLASPPEARTQRHVQANCAYGVRVMI